MFVLFTPFIFFFTFNLFSFMNATKMRNCELDKLSFDPTTHPTPTKHTHTDTHKTALHSSKMFLTLIRQFGFEICASLAAAVIFALQREWNDVFVMVINLTGLQLQPFLQSCRTLEFFAVHHPIVLTAMETALNACLPLWLLLESSATTSQHNWPFKAVCFLAHVRLSLRILIGIVQHMLFELVGNQLRAHGYDREQRDALIDSIRKMGEAIKSRGAVGLAFGTTPIGHVFAQEPIEVRIDRVAPRVDIIADGADGDHGDDQCSICHERLSTGGGPCRKLACGHTFHANCIDDWLREPSRCSCPMCRAHVALAQDDDGIDISRLFPRTTSERMRMICSLIEGFFMVSAGAGHGFANQHAPEEVAAHLDPNGPEIRGFEVRMELGPGQEIAVPMELRPEEEEMEEFYLDPNGLEIRGTHLAQYALDDEDIPPSPRQLSQEPNVNLRQRTHSAAI